MATFPIVLNCYQSYLRLRLEFDAMHKAHVSSRGQLALPKEVRDQLGLREGDCLSVRVEGDEVILRNVVTGNWRGVGRTFQIVQCPEMLEDMSPRP